MFQKEAESHLDVAIAIAGVKDFDRNPQGWNDLNTKLERHVGFSLVLVNPGNPNAVSDSTQAQAAATTNALMKKGLRRGGRAASLPLGAV